MVKEGKHSIGIFWQKETSDISLKSEFLMFLDWT